MIKSKIVLLSALVSCALISGCKEENKTNVSIEFMHSSVEQSAHDGPHHRANGPGAAWPVRHACGA